MKDSELLDACADEVSRGWRQGKMGASNEDEGAVCGVGAAYRVMRQYRGVEWAPSSLQRNPVWDLLEPMKQIPGIGIVVDKEGWQYPAVATWNDKPGRTAGEVADAFRTCAKSLREQGK